MTYTIGRVAMENIFTVKIERFEMRSKEKLSLGMMVEISFEPRIVK